MGPLEHCGWNRPDRIEVLDDSGDVVARTEDVIALGGGGSNDGFRMRPESATAIQPGQP